MKKFVYIATTCFLMLLFSACSSSHELENEKLTKPKKVDFLLETKDINNIEELEVSNNLIQILPVININALEILVDENIVDQKPILFRNQKCLFIGVASADPTAKRVEVKLSKATCKTSFEHKVNYEINGWALGEDQTFGLKAKKTIKTKELEDDKILETKTLYVKEGEYAYLSIDMVKQIETLVIKNAKKTTLTNEPIDKTNITRIHR